MRTFKAGPLTVHAAGGVDREGGGTGPAIVLCHGFGAPGTDLVSLHRVVDVGSEVRWFFPEAPLEAEMGMGGRAWWHIDIMRMQLQLARGSARDLSAEVPEGLEAAGVALASCLAALGETHGLAPKTTVLGGFSQGAMVTTDLVLSRAFRPAGLVILSGTYLAKPRWEPLALAGLAGVTVLQSHGKQDQMLPFSLAESLRDLLTSNGASVEFVPFAGQHEIPPRVLAALGGFVRSALG